MYIYIDESISDKILVQAALVIYDNKSKRNISRLVGQTIVDFKDHLRRTAPGKYAKLPGGRIIELKGAESRGKKRYIPGLNEKENRKIRDDLFRALVDQANFSIHVVYVDSDVVTQPMPGVPYKRYGRYLQKLISGIEISPATARLICVTIDSMSNALPVQERDRLYTWRKRKKQERSKRIGDKEIHRSWCKRINDLLRHRFKGRRLHRKIWVVESHRDKCLQAVDVFSNFCYRYKNLHLKIAPHRVGNFPGRPRWFETYNLIKDRTWWIHNPRIKKAKLLVRGREQSY